MCDEQATFITQVRILDLQQKFFQSGRLGSIEKKIGLQQKFFQSRRWEALKNLWPPTKKKFFESRRWVALKNLWPPTKKKFFQSGRWAAPKTIWPPTKVLSKWEMGSTENYGFQLQSLCDA
jgi:hypothetical protein